MTTLSIDFRYQSILIGGLNPLISMMSIDFRYRFLSINYVWPHAVTDCLLFMNPYSSQRYIPIFRRGGTSISIENGNLICIPEMAAERLNEPHLKCCAQCIYIGHFEDHDIWLQLPEFISFMLLLFKFVNPAED